FLPESFMHQIFGGFIDKYQVQGYNYIFICLAVCAVLSIVGCIATQAYMKKQKGKDIKAVEE
ncbi:MAG: MFS transporter, partial [Eubacterium sp.]